MSNQRRLKELENTFGLNLDKSPVEKRVEAPNPFQAEDAY